MEIRYNARNALSIDADDSTLPARPRVAAATLRGLLKLLLFALLVAELLGFNLKADGLTVPTSILPFFAGAQPVVETAPNPCTWVDVKGPGGAHFLQCMTP